MELADRLPFCPRCAYPFTGLPEAHRCPECGLAYDAESRMWTSVPSRSGMRRTINLCLGITAIALGVREFVGIIVWHEPYWERMGRAVFGVGLLFIARIFLTARQLDRNPRSRFIAILPDGIWYGVSYTEIHNIPWTRVLSVEKQSPHVDVELIIKLIPNGRIELSREFLSYADALEVGSRIRSRAAISTP